ncbi:hypothetical protein T459_25928 [Capsicum annuum]|uniref:Ubiquitin-like protease family profile domain-containing protein n=1 Tax=Capsicum annuum TaxID=4072 RepID=A0A2G2YM93_CAPAN|nr:hypothetical protein T459_25928 [Capsicum annuum]
MEFTTWLLVEYSNDDDSSPPQTTTTSVTSDISPSTCSQREEINIIGHENGLGSEDLLPLGANLVIGDNVDSIPSDAESDSDDNQQYSDKDPELQHMGYADVETSPQLFNPNVGHDLSENLDGKKGSTDLHSEKNVEIDSQQLIPDELLRSINLDYLHSEKTSNEKMDETILSDSQLTISDDMLPSLYVYWRQSIIKLPSGDREEESHDENLDDKNGHYAVVLAEIEKLAKIISLCLQACDLYVKKEIDLQNHSRYKDKNSSDMFDVLFEDNLPQQSSGSLDCGLYTVTYAECLSYGHKVPSIKFNASALRRRDATLLWDYGIRKQEANGHSDFEAPLRPVTQSRITSVTEALDL